MPSGAFKSLGHKDKDDDADMSTVSTQNDEREDERTFLSLRSFFSCLATLSCSSPDLLTSQSQSVKWSDESDSQVSIHPFSEDNK